MPRLYVSEPLADHATLSLPGDAARHVQVLRLQPGHTVTVFDGSGREWPATVRRMGRQAVDVELGAGVAVDRELPVRVTLAAAAPANDRMDWLVEKATELGVASIHPLLAQRSVLRVGGERAVRKQAHWQAVAVAACEQCGRARVPAVHAMRPLEDWLREAGSPPPPGSARWLLSLAPGARALRHLADELAAFGPGATLTLLSGPEGGWTADEEALAVSSGWTPVQLGPRVLRAETAPLAALAAVMALVAGDTPR